VDEKSEKIYYDYMTLYRDSLSVWYIDIDNDEFMKPLIVAMKNAIKTKTPLNDDFFKLSDSIDT
jgi:hypothetical protein|tara:strand:+ start:948 stop:1139 length:192 start_codon:yes stop_codon:yes gene_type:complete